MTYEEHVARAMLLGGEFFPAYHAYVSAVQPPYWSIDADTLEKCDTQKRYRVWRQHNRIDDDNVSPRERKFFNWRDWSNET